jgi:hypothetical protein
MPSVIDIDTPALVTSVETCTLTIETLERRERGRARPGWWRILVQRLMTSLTPRRRERHALACETSLDRFVREYPSLSLYAFTRI